MCEVTRSLFDTIRQFRESFDVYASKLSFEWEQIAGEGPVLYSNLEDAERISIPDYSHLLPPSVRAYSTGKVADEGHASSVQGGGHGGSYPHMVHEFLCAIRENRNSAIDADKAANWTMAGICAHKSALRGGEKVPVPETSLDARHTLRQRTLLQRSTPAAERRLGLPFGASPQDSTYTPFANAPNVVIGLYPMTPGYERRVCRR